MSLATQLLDLVRAMHDLADQLDAQSNSLRAAWVDTGDQAMLHEAIALTRTAKRIRSEVNAATQLPVSQAGINNLSLF